MTREELLAVAKPILFNTEMTRAIMDGRKTQTRRVIKPQPTCEKDGTFQWESWSWMGNGPITGIENSAPYKTGDYLYVRERYREFSGMVYCWQGGCYIPAYDFSGVEYFADNSMYRTDEGCWGEMFLPSDDIKQDIDYEKWHPSIHMPKAAARTFLQVTGVKAQQLQDITEEEAIDEGVKDPYEYQKAEWYEQRDITGNYSVDAFSGLWDSTVKKSDLPLYGWDANPWVWAYEFKKVEVKERP